MRYVPSVFPFSKKANDPKKMDEDFMLLTGSIHGMEATYGSVEMEKFLLDRLKIVQAHKKLAVKFNNRHKS